MKIIRPMKTTNQMDFEVLRAEVEEILVVLENETSVAFWGGGC